MSGPPPGGWPPKGLLFHPPRVLTLEEVAWLESTLVEPGRGDPRLGVLHSLILTAREGARRRVAEASSIEGEARSIASFLLKDARENT